MDPRRSRGLAMVLSAGALYSTAGLFTRALPYDTWTVLAWRGLFGAMFIAAALARLEGRSAWRAFAFGRWQWVSLPLIALGGIFYIFALRLTTVADVMVIYATMPFVTAAVAWLWVREVPSRRLLVASATALVGVAVMMAGGLGSGSRLLGILLTFLMNIAFAITLVGARLRPGSTMALYLVGTVLSVVIGFAFAPWEPVGPGGLATLAVFGFVTLGLAMILYMLGAGRLPPAEVSLIGIVDVVIGPALVWAVFAEDPGRPALVGGTIVIGALVWHLWPDLRRAI